MFSRPFGCWRENTRESLAVPSQDGTLFVAPLEPGLRFRVSCHLAYDHQQDLPSAQPGDRLVLVAGFLFASLARDTQSARTKLERRPRISVSSPGSVSAPNQLGAVHSAPAPATLRRSAGALCAQAHLGADSAQPVERRQTLIVESSAPLPGATGLGRANRTQCGRGPGGLARLIELSPSRRGGGIILPCRPSDLSRGDQEAAQAQSVETVSCAREVVESSKY